MNNPVGNEIVPLYAGVSRSSLKTSVMSRQCREKEIGIIVDLNASCKNNSEVKDGRRFLFLNAGRNGEEREHATAVLTVCAWERTTESRRGKALAFTMYIRNNIPRLLNIDESCISAKSTYVCFYYHVIRPSVLTECHSHYHTTACPIKTTIQKSR